MTPGLKEQWARARARARSLLASHPLALPLIVGAILRGIACAGYGTFASDDYSHVIEPAAGWLNGDTVIYCNYRSQLLPRVVWLLMELGHACGLRSPADLVRVAYAGLGAWSLLAVPGAYYATRERFGERAATVAAWLMAAQALMPRLSTRALIEVAAIPPLTWSIAFVEIARSPRGCAERGGGAGRGARAAFAAGASLGLAAMLRFQVGILVPVFFLGLLVSARDDAGQGTTVLSRQEKARRLAGLTAGLAVAAVAQLLIDLATHDPFMSAPLTYLRYNVAHSSGFGTSPWYTYLVFFVGLTVPPVTLWLARPLWHALRRLPVAAAACILFVAVHSLIPHKEERFMFPALPLFFMLLAPALVALRKGARGAVAIFIAVNTVGLVFATLSNGQRSIIDPLIAVYERGDIARVIRVGPERPIPEYYLGRRATLAQVPTETELINVAAGSPSSVRLLFDDDAAAEAHRALEGIGYRCDSPLRYQGDLVDQVVLLVNERHNKRRRPVIAIDCWPSATAVAPAPR